MIIQFVKNKFRSYLVLVLKILIVLVLVLVNEGVIFFVLVFVLFHEYITDSDCYTVILPRPDASFGCDGNDPTNIDRLRQIKPSRSLFLVLLTRDRELSLNAIRRFIISVFILTLRRTTACQVERK